MKFSIVIRDAADYDFDTEEISEDEAVEKAIKWFEERMPEVYIIKEEDKCLFF